MTLDLVLLALLCFVQNAAFTWSSRSRNSGSPGYHRYAAWCSNGLYFATSAALFGLIAEALRTGDWVMIAAAGAAYTLATTEGSVLAMRVLLARERGKHRVGAY